MHTPTNRPSRSGSSVRQSDRKQHSFGRNDRRTSHTPHRGGLRGARHSDTRPERSSGFRHGTRPQHSRATTSHGRTGGQGKRFQKTFDVSKFINKNPVRIEETTVFTPKHTFTEFGLEEKLSASVISSGLTTPTPIQDEIIPLILDGRDVIGLANTGTGKTAAFLIPLINKTLHAYQRQTLILTPTRELALQIEAELRKLSLGLKMYSTTCVGGTNIRPQIHGLRRKNHFVIGTPGRILDLIQRGIFDTTKITTVVLDEADRMLDMGFIHDMRKILIDIPKDKETLFFSATMSDDIKRLVHDFLRDPVIVSVKKQDITNSIEQDVVMFHHGHKFDKLIELLADTNMKRVIVFGAMKHSVEKLAQQLQGRAINAESIHGNKSHPQRQRSLKRFKDGQARVLVATDVAARGIHVDNVTHVVNYDLPATYEDYVHRIGRTGRGKESGKALTFVEEK